VQDVLKDPPFSYLDLLVCRNLLIYLSSQAQNRLLPLFHYALKPSGILFLGTSETAGPFTDLFALVDKKHNVYRSRGDRTALGRTIEFPTGRRQSRAAPAPVVGASFRRADFDEVAVAARDFLLKRHTPVCVIAGRDGEIIYIHGRTGKYLEPTEGRMSVNLFDLAREELKFDLEQGFREAVRSGKEQVRGGLRVQSNGGVQYLTLVVVPLDDPESLRDTVAVLFRDAPPEKESREAVRSGSKVQHLEGRIAELEQALRRTREDYRTAMEELETANEELKLVNEELHSSNEELQSTNEELASSKEELSSLNQGLSAVNAELREKMREVSEAHGYADSMLRATQLPLLFLDTELRIRRFTEEVTRLVNLMPSDVGRPLTHTSTRLTGEDLEADVRSVMKHLRPLRKLVQSSDGGEYLMNVLPFRRKDRIEGAVVAFIDAAELERVRGNAARD
jgi:two-component system CheB/CheR fusion protein